MPFAPVLFACGYLALVVTAAELLRHQKTLSTESARAVIHAGTGLLVLPIVWMFPDWRMAVIPPLILAAANFVIYRYRLLPSLSDDPTNPGAVFHPVSFVVLLALFFRPGSPDDLSHIAVAGVLAMALGDTAAALCGRRYGTRRFTILGASRTMEGSLAMFLVAGAAIAGTLVATGALSPHPAAAFGLVIGTAAAGLEAISPFGSDNLTVPLGTAGILYLLLRISEAALGIG